MFPLMTLKAAATSNSLERVSPPPTTNYCTQIISYGEAERKALTLGEMIMMSRRRSYLKKAIDHAQYYNHSTVYSADLETRLGITAGICILIKNMPETKGKETGTKPLIYSFHLGEYGQISVQGAYVTTEDTYLSVTSGTGVFAGAYGQVKLQQLVFPFKLFYTFYLQGLSADLPSELLVTPVTPLQAVEASSAVKGD